MKVAFESRSAAHKKDSPYSVSCLVVGREFSGHSHASDGILLFSLVIVDCFNL